MFQELPSSYETRHSEQACSPLGAADRYKELLRLVFRSLRGMCLVWSKLTGVCRYWLKSRRTGLWFVSLL